MKRPPAASTPATWLETAAPVNEAGFVVVGPTGVAVAVAEPPGLEGVEAPTVLLPGAVEEPPVGGTLELEGVVMAGPDGVVVVVPEVQGTVTVV